MTWQSFKQAWLIRFWSPVPAVIAAGILSTYYFGITGTFWAVTGEFTRWGGQLLQLLGVHSEQWGYYQLIHLEGSPLTRIDGRMIIGMFGRIPKPSSQSSFQRDFIRIIIHVRHVQGNNIYRRNK